jgi:hypothetical protein
LKKYRKLLVYAALTVGVIFIALVVSVFLFKERIIRQFIQEANKQLNTPVKVGKLDVSILQHFPRLSIVITDVYIEDSHPGNYPLFTAKQLSFVMHPYEVFNGTYNIHGIYIEDSETNLKINAEGKNNYTVLKDTKGQSGGTSLRMELRDVKLRKTRVHYFDLKTKEDLVFISDDLKASIATDADLYNIEAQGHLLTEKISIEGRSFLAGKSFQVESELLYDDIKKSLLIKPSVLKLARTSFGVEGNYEWKKESMIDLKVEGKDADIQTILSLLPENVSDNLKKYQSEGGVYFNAHLNGEWSKRKNPSFTVDFGFSDATIFHPEYKTRITDATMKGSFKSKDVTDVSHARLSLANVKGNLNGEPFKGNLSITDFGNPLVVADFKGRLDAASVLGFYPVEELQNVNGSLTADVSINGRISLLKSRKTANQVTTQGTIDLGKISFLYGKQKIPVKELSGSLQFSNNDLALSNVAGSFGNSDYILNGFFKNIITFLLFEDQPIGIEADLRSKFLDVDELFKLAYSSDEPTASSSDYRFDISKNVYLNFNCDVDALKYKRFKGRRIKGDLLVKNKVAVSRNLTLETMGGTLVLSGIVDANNNKAIDVVCTSKLNKISIDSVFYVFENFDQDFIQDKHLKGDVSADVGFEMVLNQNLRLYPETLIADIGAVIKNGELNNFEPLRKLKKYVDDEGLSRLRFSDLKNDIHIENKTVYIPQMLVNSNVTTLRISGTHTFDQRIDYRIIAPLRGKKSTQDAEFVKAVDLDDKGQTRLFLKIIGTTDEYKVMYDTEAVKNKIASDLKREVRELKDAFRNKETQKKKELELQEDDYFEWSE